MKFTSPLIASASGSMGGAVASRNRGGQYLRRRAMPTNPGTEQQVSVRGAFAAASQRWALLTEPQRVNWNAYAEATPWQNSLGETIKMSGQQAYVRARALWAYANGNGSVAGTGAIGSSIDDGPTENTLGPYAASGGAWTGIAGPPVEWEADLFVGNDADTTSLWIAFFSGSVNATKNYYKGPYLLVGGGASIAGVVNVPDTAVQASAYFEKLGYPVSGQSYFGYIRSLTADGRVGTPRRFGPLVVPVPA